MQTSALPLISSPVLAVFQQAAGVLKPPPKTSITQWAERKRHLSSESSATVGPYRSLNAPYQRQMQDAILWPGVEEVVLWTGTQMGKSTAIENILGYFMDEDPSPIIYIWPTEKMAKEWSIDTLNPILRDSPALAQLVGVGARTSSNSNLYKKFPGGALTIIGANSPATLRRRRARVILADDVDGFPVSAGAEGDSIMLVAERSKGFWNAVRVLASTCTIHGESRIEAAYAISDRRKFWVPCPHCSQAKGEPDGFQLLRFSRLIKDKVEPHTNTCYPCEHCGAELTELDKSWMLAHGEWRAENPSQIRIPGFWINSLYSPFVTWAQMAGKFFQAMAQRENPNILQVFYNGWLAKTWELREEYIGTDELKKRVEEYPERRPRLGGGTDAIVPREVAVLTAGVDVQADRVEVELVGWGRGEESWSLDFVRFEGDTAQPEVWEKLDGYLAQEWWHALAPDDVSLQIAAAFVDSGFRAAHVYAFTKTRAERRIFASKGVSRFGKPIVGKWNRNNQARVRMYPIAVDVLKELIYSRLRIAPATSIAAGQVYGGPGFMHFSRQVNLQENPDYLEQLTAERIERKPVHGFPVRFWFLPPGKRNEALDCRVYATAALHSLVNLTPVAVLLDQLHRRLVDEARSALAKRKARISEDQLRLPVADILPDAEAAPLGTPEAVPAVAEEPKAEENAPLAELPPEPTPDPPLLRRRSTWL
jgi:phage terminase large subunit GpA-like protein